MSGGSDDDITTSETRDDKKVIEEHKEKHITRKAYANLHGFGRADDSETDEDKNKYEYR